MAQTIDWPVRTVEKWLARETAPNGTAMVTLIGAYGPEFLATVLPVTRPWVAAAARAERRDRIRSEMAALAAQLDE